MIEREYQSTVDSQHASEELIQKTLSQMRAAQNEPELLNRFDKKKRRSTRFRDLAAIAACLVLVIGTVLYLNTDRVVYFDVDSSTMVGVGTMHLGHAGQATENLLSDINHISVKNDAFLPGGLTNAKPVTLSGKEVYFGKDETTLYATYSNESGWELFYSEALTQKEFTSGIKAYLSELN